MTGTGGLQAARGFWAEASKPTGPLGARDRHPVWQVAPRAEPALPVQAMAIEAMNAKNSHYAYSRTIKLATMNPPILKCIVLKLPRRQLEIVLRRMTTHSKHDFSNRMVVVPILFYR